MNNLLSCGHPVECFNMDDDYCEWCADIERLREENDSLQAQPRKQAIIVNGGEPHFDGKEIGLLEIRGGVVHLAAGQCNQVATYYTDRNQERKENGYENLYAIVVWQIRNRPRMVPRRRLGVVSA